MQIFAQRLKQEREIHLWSQEQVAQMIGTTAPTISRWEHSSTFPGLHFRQKLCELFAKSAEELGFLQDNIQRTNEEMPVQIKYDRSATSPVSLVSPSIWNVPYRKNPFFTGRDDVLEHLHKLLHTGNTAILTQVQALCGLGGIGKTQAAVEYAYRFGSEYTAILWAQAENHDVLQAEFVKLASLLDLPEKGQQDVDRIVKAVSRWLHDHRDWLLILDNMEELSILGDFIPAGGKGSILLTTRVQSTRTFAHHINLEQMEPEEGALLLLRRAVRIECDAPLEAASHIDRNIAREISRVMGGLPLALDQAGAYIEETACSLSDYLERYQKRPATLLNLRDLRGGTSTTHPQSVTTTFALTFDLVERTNPVAADLMRLCVFFQPDAIPESILLEGAPELGPILQPLVGDPFLFDTAIAALRTHSLLHRNSGTKTLTLHCLVQAVLKDSMDAETQRLWSERALKAANRMRLRKKSASR